MIDKLITPEMPKVQWKRERAKAYKSKCGRFEIRNWGEPEVKGDGKWVLFDGVEQSYHRSLTAAKNAATSRLIDDRQTDNP